MMKPMCLLLLLSGCGSAVATPKPLTCDRSDRHGVYLTEFTPISGDCPALPSSLINFDDPNSTAGCTPSGTTWSEGDCKLSTSTKCAQDANGVSTDATGVTTQETQDGSLLEGTFSIRMMDTRGPGCGGTYHVRYTRQ